MSVKERYTVAKEAGLRVADVIATIDGEEDQSLWATLRKTETLYLTIQREGTSRRGGERRNADGYLKSRTDGACPGQGGPHGALLHVGSGA